MLFRASDDSAAQHAYAEMRHIQEHGLYMPRDFDVSPYFQIIKPTLALGFDPHHRQATVGIPATGEA